MARKVVILLALAGLALTAQAGQQFCGQEPVAADARACPDGSIPVFRAETLDAPARPAPAARPLPAAPAARGSADARALLGVWRTRVPGAVWTSPAGYSGSDWLHVSSGVAAGDLIIRPDGTYVWQSYGGKRGRWVAGDSEYPIVLIDAAEHKRWKVGRDPRRTGGRELVVWDGNSLWYDGRR